MVVVKVVVEVEEEVVDRWWRWWRGGGVSWLEGGGGGEVAPAGKVKPTCLFCLPMPLTSQTLNSTLFPL